MSNKGIFCSCASSLSLGLALSVSFAGATGALAQTSGPNEEESAVFDTIVVTAQKREENVLKTALAISALTGDDLAKKNIEELSDLQFATPSLSVTSVGLTSNVNIRGIGLNSQNPNVVSGVALYRDGLFQAPILSREPFYDIGGVEVLRGPQGTFVGANSTGGAIFVNSRSPDLEAVNGYVSAQGGNYKNIRAQGAVNLPLSDTLAARLAVNFERRDSFFENLGSAVAGDAPEPGRVRQKNVRLGLLWEPVDTLSVLLKNEYSGDSTDGYAFQPVRTAFFAPADPYTIDYNRTDVQNKETGTRSSLEIKYQFSPDGVTLRSLSGFQYAKIKLNHDLDASPFDIVYGRQNVVEKIYSQEINLLSPDGQAFEWVLGGYYIFDDIDLDLENVVNLPPPTGGVTTIATNTTKENASAFAHAGYEVLPGVKVEGGIRYSYDQSKGNGTLILSGFPIPLGSSFDDGTITGKAAVNWTINPNHFLYAFAARGYKSGGSNGGMQTFDGETVWDYELGWKGTLFDGHVRTQIDGFYMDYNDMQITNIDTSVGTGAGIVNAGGASIKGAEAQVQAQFGGFGVDGSVAYVDSSVSAPDLIDVRALPGQGNIVLGPQCAPGQVMGCFDYSPFLVSVDGRPNPFSPEWTFNAGVEYAFDFGDAGVLTPRVDYSYASSQYTTLIEVIPSDYLGPRNVWNAQVRYDNKEWSLVGFVTNFTNDTFVAGQMQAVEFYNAPRQYGARIERRF